jgi:type II secretory pathway pseudopilin PulG
MAFRTLTIDDMDDRKRPIRRRLHGFTLAEGLIASVILAIAVVGILTLVSSAASQAAVVRQDAAALSLARQLMERMAGVPFLPSAAHLGYSAGNFDSATYDDINDFDGYTDTVSTMVAIAGQPSAGDARSYTRSVAVTANAWPVAPADFKRITVTVTPPQGRPVTLSRLVTAADPERE